MDNEVCNDGCLKVDGDLFSNKKRVLIPFTEHNFKIAAQLVANGAEILNDDCKDELLEEAKKLSTPVVDEKKILIDSLKDSNETLTLAVEQARTARNKLVPQEILDKIRDKARIEIEDKMAEYISSIRKSGNGKVPRDSEGYRANVSPLIEKRIDELLLNA